MTAAYLVESYTYDESGNRITVTNSGGATYYVYDASGNVLAIYSGSTLKEVPVYGSSRLGTYFTSGSYYVYELRDNVGSVRVTVTGTKTGSQANTNNYTDYFPFGAVSQTAGTNYRYEYQGAYSEKDQATGYNNFNLRMYDANIGRWLSIDPKNVGFTPYNGMGNDPVTSFDKDGGDPSTDVTKNDDGTYTVINGRVDGDLNIYVVNNAKDDQRTGEVIGRSVSDYSFLDDQGKPVVGAIINQKDNHGRFFLRLDIVGNKQLSLGDYMLHAYGHQEWDFKTNGPDGEINGLYLRPKGMTITQYW